MINIQFYHRRSKVLKSATFHRCSVKLGYLLGRALKNPTKLCSLHRAVGWFLFSKISESSIVHVPTFFPLLHWFQNTFCFLCSSTPSHGGSFFLKIAIYNGDMAGGISNNRFWAITFDWGDLRRYGQHLWATFLMLFSGIPHLAKFLARSLIAK